MTAMILFLAGVAAMACSAGLLVRATAHRRRPWSDRTTGRLAWAALAWTVLAAGVLLLAPMVTTESASSGGWPSSAGEPTEVVTTRSQETLLEYEGASVVAVLLVPVGIALVGAPGSGPPARKRRIVAGSVLVGACMLGAMSLGVFYLPAAAILLTAGLKTRSTPAVPTAA
jgi:hypothetical protein